MMRFLFFTCFIVLSSFSSYAQLLVKTDLPAFIDKVSEADVEQNLRAFLRQSSPSRFPGTSGHRAARQFIINQIKNGQSNQNEILVVDDFEPDINYSVNLFQNDFDTLIKGQIPQSDPEYKKWENYTLSSIKLLRAQQQRKGANIVWEKKGKNLSEKKLLVLTNYDTLVYDKDTMLAQANQIMPGADSNASGVIAALQLIKLLQKIDLTYTVRIVFLDMESLGFLGSRHIANSKDLPSFSFAINLLMLGHDSIGGDKLKIEGNRRFYGRTGDQSDKMMASQLIRAGNWLNGPLKTQYIDNSFRQGSAFTLWEKGLSALVYTHDWENDSNEERAFTQNDFIETLNLKTLTNSIKYISSGIIAWALAIDL